MEPNEYLDVNLKKSELIWRIRILYSSNAIKNHMYPIICIYYMGWKMLGLALTKATNEKSLSLYVEYLTRILSKFLDIPSNRSLQTVLVAGWPYLCCTIFNGQLLAKFRHDYANSKDAIRLEKPQATIKSGKHCEKREILTGGYKIIWVS